MESRSKQAELDEDEDVQHVMVRHERWSDQLVLQRAVCAMPITSGSNCAAGDAATSCEIWIAFLASLPITYMLSSQMLHTATSMHSSLSKERLTYKKARLLVAV